MTAGVRYKTCDILQEKRLVKNEEYLWVKCMTWERGFDFGPFNSEDQNETYVKIVDPEDRDQIEPSCQDLHYLPFQFRFYQTPFLKVSNP